MELPFKLFGKKKKEEEISAMDVYGYVEKNLTGMSKLLMEIDSRIKLVEDGRGSTTPPSPIEMRMSNMEQAIIALNNDLNNVASDHLMLKSVARYRKEFKHLQPPLPNIKTSEQVTQPEEIKQPVAMTQSVVRPPKSDVPYVVEDETDVETPIQIPRTPTQEPQRVKLPKLIR